MNNELRLQRKCKCENCGGVYWEGIDISLRFNSLSALEARPKGNHCCGNSKLYRFKEPEWTTNVDESEWRADIGIISICVVLREGKWQISGGLFGYVSWKPYDSADAAKKAAWEFCMSQIEQAMEVALCKCEKVG